MKRDSRILVPLVFGLVGGLLLLATHLWFLVVLSGTYGSSPLLFGLLGSFGIASGTFVIVGATMSFRRPSHGIMWGVVTVVFGSLGVFGQGGFALGILSFQGMTLAIVSGALAIVGGATGRGAEAPGQRACLGCGTLVDRDFAHCPHCGHAMPSPPR